MYYIGIDVGGTNLVAGLVDGGANLLYKAGVPVDKTKNAGQLCMELLGLARRVLFPGQTADMAPWFAAADAAVSASRSR